jgi:DisA bacterial checkpoint controller nucleotide-binding
MTRARGRATKASKTKIWPSDELFPGLIKQIAMRLFNQLDIKLAPHVFVLAIPNEDNTEATVVLKPEDECGYEPSLFSNVLAKAVKWYEKTGAKQLGGRFPAVEEDRRRLEAFQEAVVQILSPSDKERGIISYCSQPIKFNGYKVCCVLQLNSKAYGSHYSLPQVEWRASVRLPKSLIDAAAVEYLRACIKILRERNPGGDWEIRHKEDEILRSAGQELTSRAVVAGCNAPMRPAFDALNTISLSAYEGAKARGKVRIISHDHEDLIMEVKFLKPVEVKESRAARKMVEMASRKVDLLCNGHVIYGLGRVRENYDEFYGEIYTVEFPGNHSWLLKHGDNILMKVQYGKPSLPGERLEKEVFRDHVERIFKGGTPVNFENLWKIAMSAAEQEHGTMIVISSGAESEATRLSKQSTMIEPVALTEDNLLAVTAIDGAVLSDLIGKCYAVGVILDGMASEEGTSARGARYNSAIRYVGTNTDGHQCLVLVVSEDGTIDLVPKLEPKIRRSEMDGYVKRLRAINNSKTVNIKEYLRVMQWISANSFYLMPTTCRVVNKLKNTISSRPGVGTSWHDFKPNKKMNKSYFLD